MKTILAAGLVLAAAATPALAIGRYNALSYTCADMQRLIQREKAVILRHPAKRSSMTLYDRYVADGRYCDAGFYAANTFLVSKDNPDCPVKNCSSASDLDDDFPIP